MAGITAAWRLSEPGWRDELESITVYQRGWRLGGKGASSRGVHGRIEEHGLHLWLGYYENAFRLLRECYAELDRPTTDPTARLRTWRDAMLPTEDVGLEHVGGDGWQHWVGRFTPNDESPGEPGAPIAGLTVVDYVRRALRLVVDFLESLPAAAEPRGVPTAATATLLAGAPIVALAGILEATAQLDAVAAPAGLEGVIRGLDRALGSMRTSVRELAEEDADVRRTWHLVSVMAASVRGVLADGLLTHPDGFRAANDEDFVDWIVRHGAAPEVAEFAFIRGLYDLVFADLGPERGTRGVAAGTAVFMTSKMFFEYKGAIFWKMAAGMGDVVFAPMYEALRRRGVEFEFFHRVDDLHVGADGLGIDAVTMGRQAALAGDRDRYEPLVRVGDLPCFPAAPLADQLCDPDRLAGHDLESHWCPVPDVESRVLRRGVDFDDVVLAIPIGMAAHVCGELVAASTGVGPDDGPARNDRHAGVAAVAPPAGTGAGLGVPGRDRQRVRAAVQHVGVDGPARGGRVLARGRSARDDRLLLRRARRTRRAGGRRHLPRSTTRSGVTAHACCASSNETSRTSSRGRASRGECAGICCAERMERSAPRRWRPSSSRPTSTRRTATCSARPAPTGSGSGRTSRASTTSPSPATGPTTV